MGPGRHHACVGGLLARGACHLDVLFAIREMCHGNGAARVMQVTFTKAATKALKALPTEVQIRLLHKVRAYASDPASQAQNVRPLKGRAGYRLRVGDYRVLFTVDDGELAVMTVYRVGHRKEVYDG